MTDHQHVGVIAKHLADAASYVVVLGTLMQWLPSLAALASLIWTGIRIYEWAAKKFRGQSDHQQK